MPTARPIPAKIRRLLAGREQQGWSWAELSRRCGEPVWRLQSWNRRLENPPNRAGLGEKLSPVHVVDRPTASPVALELVFPSGIRLPVPAEFDEGHLRRVLAAVVRAC